MEVKAGRELSAARDLAAGGDASGAIVHYFRALNWYAPWGASQAAAGELYALGEGLAARGDREGAYLAFLRLRAGLNASRSFYRPRPELLDAANARVAEHLARERLGAGADPDALARQAALYLSLYRAAPAMNEGWYLAASGGFLMWTLGAVLALFRFFPQGDRPLARRLAAARAPLGCFALGYALWLLGMWLA
jgi:hypothetical protein